MNQVDVASYTKGSWFSTLQPVIVTNAAYGYALRIQDESYIGFDLHNEYCCWK